MSSGKSIVCYFDCVSPYGYIGVRLLNRYKTQWKDVHVELKPVFLGAIMNGSKNSPPLTVAAKGAYMPSDLVRISRATNIPLRFPSSFPSLTVSAMRLLIVIKEQEPAKFDQCVEQLYDAHWANDKDISQNEVLVTVLGPILGSMDKVEQYLQMASTPEIKKALTDNTNEALAKGAFGVPSFIVKRSSTDKEHLFFGSDRFELMSSFLDLPYQGLDPRSAML